MTRIAAIVSLLLLAACDLATDYSTTQQITDIPVLEAYISADRYAELLSNRWSNEKAPVEIAVGARRHRGTLEPQGAGSRYHARWSYKLSLDEGDEIHGLRVSNLSAQIFDDSRLRTALASHVFGALGFLTFDFHPVFLKINGVNKGLYLQIERFEEEWFRRRGVPVSELIKAGFGARFSYDGGLHLARYFEKEIPDDDNLNGFGDFIHALDAADPDRLFEEVGPHLDIAQYLRYHAASSALNHVDGFTNNLLFYRETPGAPYRVIPWDFDKVMYAASDVQLMGGNDIIWKLLQNDSCVAIYKRELLNIAENVMAPENIFPVLDAFAAAIAQAHALDPALGESGKKLSTASNELKLYLIHRRSYFLENIGSIVRLPR